MSITKVKKVTRYVRLYCFVYFYTVFFTDEYENEEEEDTPRYSEIDFKFEDFAKR